MRFVIGILLDQRGLSQVLGIQAVATAYWTSSRLAALARLRPLAWDVSIVMRGFERRA